MDSLANRSFVFENTYVTQAVCTPARGSLMTGLYPHSHGCTVNGNQLADGIPTLGEMLPDTYRKAHFGKWHLGNDAFCQHGFDEWQSCEDDRRASYTLPDSPMSDYHQWLVENGFTPAERSASGDLHFGHTQRSTLPAEFQIGAFVANQSDGFIRANTHRPWLLVFSTFEPHPPYTGPYDGMYDPESLPTGPTFMTHPAENHALFNRSRASFYPTSEAEPVDIEDMRQEASWRKLRAQYFGNAKIVDDAVGKLLRALEDTGQMDRTAFAFTSDHGEMAGDHSMWEKRAFYEESARVPMLLSVPWLATTQRRIGGVLGHVDLVPTLLELAGQAGTEVLPGGSVASELIEDHGFVEHDAFLEWNGVGDRNLGTPQINQMATIPWRSMVSADRWKLNLCVGDQCELFDLNTDPSEVTNLFDDPRHHDRVRRMTVAIRNWQIQTGDTADLPAV
jgi:arylsulfatase A-like enzyme